MLLYSAECFPRRELCLVQCAPACRGWGAALGRPDWWSKEARRIGQARLRTGVLVVHYVAILVEDVDGPSQDGDGLHVLVGGIFWIDKRVPRPLYDLRDARWLTQLR